MADSTGIQWTDSTFNPWWGCTKVSPGCDHCYAEVLDKRTGGSNWGGTPRIMSESYWNKPQKWDKAAFTAQERRRVFCGSMCDVFDNKAPLGVRQRLWGVIKKTVSLDWQLLTKRTGNIEKMLPVDWGDGWDNVWLGTSIEDQERKKRIDTLRAIPAKLRFLSLEPLLEDLGELDFTGIHWVIVGGESGRYARGMQSQWVYDIMTQCKDQGVAFFFKQWGARTGKGGCELNGIEVKEWPDPVAPVFKDLFS